MKNSNLISWVQIWAYPEHPPPKWKTLTFFPEFKSELTQNPPAPPNEKLTFFPEFKSELTQNAPPPKWKTNLLSWVQIWAYPEHHPPKWKTLTFFPEFKCELTQNTHPPPPVVVEVCGDCIPQGYHLGYHSIRIPTKSLKQANNTPV